MTAAESIGRAPNQARLTVAVCPFDTAYDYELAKLPHDIVLLGNTHRDWDRRLRPLPDSVRVSYALEDAGADLLILGIDQWSWDEVEERTLFLRLRDQFRGPKIIVNHGCNLVDGRSSEAMRFAVGNNPMVCGTDSIKDLWKVEKSRVIRRGLAAGEWPATDYSRGNIVTSEPWHHASFCNEPAVDHLLVGLNRKVDRLGRTRAIKSFDAYRSFLSTSSIFFNPSYAAPNLGAMVEAQLCGLAVVTTDSHGESAYIRNGENGFATNDMNELLAFIKVLRANPKEVRRIGLNGRRTAQDVFDGDRFLAEWDALLRETVREAPR